MSAFVGRGVILELPVGTELLNRLGAHPLVRNISAR
jgi:hypothetical protein